MFTKFFVQPLDEWFDLDQTEMQREGSIPYLIQLHSLGANKVERDGKVKNIVDEIACFPFTMDEARIYFDLLNDGWERSGGGRIEAFGLMPFFDVNGRTVAPLEKNFDRLLCIFDFAGFKWFISDEGRRKREVLYPAPLPF